ncbi:hypothetical protein GCM10007939_00200 [Amylibacter marinus]|uniref:DUF5672 domain-containing protein n=1 Tax=Amylibacter marinus TaxID=1475483 RepID=A0ABQ5VRK0_9RHOB|nr:hypothetical protein [Amylibacter marinus]GLQ33737.1 hypothetical protein GCM10007939_00200 [Amylibacter marinus]
MKTLSYAHLQSQEKLGASAKTIALIFADDDVNLHHTITHAMGLGFQRIFIFGNPELTPDLDDDRLIWVTTDILTNDAVIAIVNTYIGLFPNTWIHYCFNAEYLYFPFCDTRGIGDFVGFLDEEKRLSAFASTIDLYPESITNTDQDFAPQHAHLDRIGYYSHARRDEFGPLPRQLDVFGGLRWRFEEHIPWERRRINNASVFKASEGLKLGQNFTFNIPEYETVQCEWHNSPTTCVCSFRAAKYLLNNPESRAQIRSFSWPNSIEFDQSAKQLLELGMMEPGQWF